MTEKEALKLALEALKYPLNQSHENFNVDMAELLAHRAITAIKEALAQPEQETPKGWKPEIWKSVTQPEQEPVAWVYPEGLEALKAGKPWTAYGTRQEPNNTALYLSPQPDIPPYAYVTFTPYGDEDDVWYENPEGQLLEGWTYKPLYDTTPPQRTWVGLTDEDKQTAFDATQEGGGFWEFADAIEAKLKEKNT